MRRATSISENQFGIMPKRSTIEAIHLMRQMIEYYKARKRDLHIVFLTWINIEQGTKGCTLVDNDKKGIPTNYINIEQDMNREVKMNVWDIWRGNTRFPNHN